MLELWKQYVSKKWQQAEEEQDGYPTRSLYIYNIWVSLRAYLLLFFLIIAFPHCP